MQNVYKQQLQDAKRHIAQLQARLKGRREEQEEGAGVAAAAAAATARPSSAPFDRRKSASANAAARSAAAAGGREGKHGDAADNNSHGSNQAEYSKVRACLLCCRVFVCKRARLCARRARYPGRFYAGRLAAVVRTVGSRTYIHVRRVVLLLRASCVRLLRWRGVFS